MEPRLPVDQILSLLGLTPEKWRAIDQNANNKLLGVTAAGLGGPPKMKEAASFYANRYPQILDALAQPGMRNKTNAVSSALANEGTNMIGDALIEHGLPFVAGLIGSRASPQAGAAAATTMKGAAPYINLAKDAIQSEFVDPHVYTGMNTLNPAQYLPSIHDLTGLVSKNDTVRNVMSGVGRVAVDNLDANITGWAAEQLKNHPTPQIKEPIRKALTEDIPKKYGGQSSIRQVVKPLNDAALGKKPWGNAFQDAIFGAIHPDKAKAKEDAEKQRKFNEYGKTALEGSRK